MNLTKTLSPFVCLGCALSVKWPQITWFWKNVEKMDSFKIFLYLSVAVNVEIHVIYTLKL